MAAAGSQTQCAYVQAIDDEIPEPTESFTFLLVSENDSVIVIDYAATVNILDINLAWWSNDKDKEKVNLNYT